MNSIVIKLQSKGILFYQKVLNISLDYKQEYK